MGHLESNRREIVNWDLVALVISLVCCALAFARHRYLLRKHSAIYGRAAKEEIRVRWLDNMLAQPQHFILAIQTLRNSIMASTLMATALGVVIASAPAWGPEVNRASAQWHDSAGFYFNAGLFPVKIGLIVSIALSAIANFALAIRHYHQLGYTFMPESPQNIREAAHSIMLSATRQYGYGVRLTLAILPLIVWLLDPLIAAALAAGVLLIASLFVLPKAIKST